MTTGTDTRNARGTHLSGTRPSGTVTGPRVAVVDNYDSFTYNLVQYLAELGADPVVHRSDEVDVTELARHDLVVVSPGPGTPAGAGVSVQAIRELSGRVPLLGVCLGHQCIAEAFGAAVVRTHPVHGKTSAVRHDGTGVLRDLPTPFTATRYHSLTVAPESVPDVLAVNAWAEDGSIMGLRHRDHHTYGVQFHPESVLTDHGRGLMANFLALA